MAILHNGTFTAFALLRKVLQTIGQNISVVTSSSLLTKVNKFVV